MDRSDGTSSSTAPSIPPAAFWKYLQLLANRSENTVASSAVTLAVQAALQYPEEQRLPVALSELERKGVNCDVLMNHAQRLLAMNSNSTTSQTPTASYNTPSSTPAAQTSKQSQPTRQQPNQLAPSFAINEGNEGSSPFDTQNNFHQMIIPQAQPVAQGQGNGGRPRNPQVGANRPPASLANQWPAQHPNTQGTPQHWAAQQHQPPPDRVIRNTSTVPHPLHSWEMEEHYGPVHVTQETQRPITATPGGFMPPLDDGTKFVHEKLQDVMSRRRLSLGVSPQERTEIALLIHRTLFRWVIRVWSVLIKFSLLRTDHVRRALDNEVSEDFSAIFCLEGWKSDEEKFKNEVELLSPGKGTDKRKQARKKKGPKSQNNELDGGSPHDNSQEDSILSSGEAQVAAMMEEENPKEIEESIDALKESGISSYPDFGAPTAPDETSPKAAANAISTTEEEARSQAVVKRMQGHLTREVSLKDLRQLLQEYSFELPVQLKVRYLRLIEVRHYDSKGAPLMQLLADERSVASRDFQAQQNGPTSTTTISTKFSELLSKSTKPPGVAPVVETSTQGKIKIKLNSSFYRKTKEEGSP
eukprot:GHVP01013780.1.p1 GENE.GHVP01013780.1~~GHVP01013780.1.p1  ORF type:complete len:585 (+),score=142.35 GHVP01013780.1:48-1802(+)